jgi:hypothetical protein
MTKSIPAILKKKKKKIASPNNYIKKLGLVPIILLRVSGNF